MRRRSLVLLLAGCASILPRGLRAEKIDVDVGLTLTPVDQGNANLCWLAAAAMMRSWQEAGASVSMSQLATELGPPFRQIFEEGQANPSTGALPLSLVNPLFKKLGLRGTGLQSFKISWWVERLKTGPVFLAGYATSAVMAHAVVLVGLRGDTADFPSLEVRIVDPAGAIRRSATLGSVIKFYEGLAGPATDASAPQILYF